MVSDYLSVSSQSCLPLKLERGRLKLIYKLSLFVIFRDANRLQDDDDDGKFENAIAFFDANFAFSDNEEYSDNAMPTVAAFGALAFAWRRSFCAYRRDVDCCDYDRVLRLENEQKQCLLLLWRFCL